MKKNITLYNHFHNGDLFYSRILTNILSKHFKITYYHNQRAPLFEDLPEIEEIVGIPPEFGIHTTNLEKNIVNTWIGQKNMYYVTHQIVPGCSFQNHFKLVKDICDFYEIKLNDDINEYLPTVHVKNLNSYNNIVEDLMKLKTKYKLIILVCDGNVNSGQSYNFSFVPVIESLAVNNPDCLFLTTNQSYNDTCGNIINIYPNITKTLPDLLQINIISNYTDIIVGRASGPVCFTHTKNNFNDPNKTFISFTFNQTEGEFYSEGKNKNVWTNNFNNDNINQLIQTEINLKLN